MKNRCSISSHRLQLGASVNFLQGPLSLCEPRRAVRSRRTHGLPPRQHLLVLTPDLLSALTGRKSAWRHRCCRSLTLLPTALHGHLTSGAAQNACQPVRPSTEDKTGFGPWRQRHLCPGGCFWGHHFVNGGVVGCPRRGSWRSRPWPFADWPRSISLPPTL